MTLSTFFSHLLSKHKWRKTNKSNKKNKHINNTQPLTIKLSSSNISESDLIDSVITIDSGPMDDIFEELLLYSLRYKEN